MTDFEPDVLTALAALSGRNPPVEHVTHNINLTQVRAPTDEGLKLLNEMQQKARDNIIGTLTLKDNGLEAEAYFYREPMRRKICGECHFKINGSALQARAEVDDGRNTNALSALMLALREKIADEIAAKVVAEAWRPAMFMEW